MCRRYQMSYYLLIFVFTCVACNTIEDGILTTQHSIGNNQLTKDPLKQETNFSTSVQSSSPTVISPKPTAAINFPTCPSGVMCSKLGGECISCIFNRSCVYGAEVNVMCTVHDSIKCEGPRDFKRSMICRFCYQTDPSEHICRGLPLCRVASAPRERYITNCTVKSEVLCMGHRKFSKNLLCNWTSGYRWSTTLILSITLGGFGGDRFYLGHWQEGVGKLFSFGGLGVWTIVDVILVAVGYLKPADGSLYIW